MNSVHLPAGDCDISDKLELLIKRKLPFIRRLAKGVVQPGMDYDDAVQEGLIALVSAISTYDNSRGASLNTYADVCIRNAIITAVRSATGKKNSFLNSYVSLDETELAGNNCVHDALSYAEALAQMEDRLSDNERIVLRLRLAGLSYSEIANKLEITEKSVDNALSRIRRKLK